jgi:hypothetical protein
MLMMTLNAKRILVLAAIALAGFIVPPPLAAAAPPGHTVRVGVLGMFAPSFDPTTDPLIREFIDGLRELGYTPGRATSSSSTKALRAIPRRCRNLPRNSCSRGWKSCWRRTHQ